MQEKFSEWNLSKLVKAVMLVTYMGGEWLKPWLVQWLYWGILLVSTG